MVGGGSRPTQDTGMSLELEPPGLCRCAQVLLPSQEPPPSLRCRAAVAQDDNHHGRGLRGLVYGCQVTSA